MAETSSALEGLQSIIPPTPPVPGDMGWLIAGLVLSGFVLSAAVVFVLMRHHSGYQARRSFSHLRSRMDMLKPAEIGDGLVAILRISLNSHNLKRSCKPASVKTISQYEWSTLLDHCDQLRYATQSESQTVIPEAIELIQKMLRGRG